MFLAAFSSRSSTSPQVGQIWVRMLSDLGTRSPHPLHSWLVSCGGIASHPTPGAHCRGFEDAAERGPAGIADALGEAAIPPPIGDPQIFEGDGVVGAQQGQRGLVVEVAPLPREVLVRLGEQRDRLLAACAALLAACAALLAAAHAPLRLRQFLLAPAVVARMLDRITLGGDEEHLQAHVDARLAPGGCEGLNRYVRAGYAGVPAVRLLGDRHRLGRAIEGARPTHGHAPDLRQDQAAIVETGAAMLADLRIGEAVVAAPPSEAGIARRLAGSHATEERLEGAIQSQEHILQDLRVDLRVLRACRFQARQFGLLLGVRGTPAFSASPPRLALFPGGVRERAALPQDGFQRLFLFGQWLQFVSVCSWRSCGSCGCSRALHSAALHSAC